MGVALSIKGKKNLKTSFPRPERLSKDIMSETDNSENGIRELIINEVGDDVLAFISNHVELSNGATFVTSTTTRFNIDKLKKNSYSNIVNLKRVNDVRWLNKFFESINSRLNIDGIYINSVESYKTRKIRILRRYAKPFNYLHYTFDVFLTRVFPKLPFTKRIYFFITKGRGRVLSRAETYGRLYSCGFEIIDERRIGTEIYYVAKKVKKPVFDNSPTYGPIIRLKRYGKGG